MILLQVVLDAAVLIINFSSSQIKDLCFYAFLFDILVVR